MHEITCKPKIDFSSLLGHVKSGGKDLTRSQRVNNVSTFDKVLTIQLQNLQVLIFLKD